MDSKQYADQSEFVLAGVRFVSKAKPCGKENCSACPHAGYWYAYVSAELAKDGYRTEVYCGRSWSSDDLLGKIAPVLKRDPGRAFAREIRLILDRERLERLKAEAVSLLDESARLRREFAVNIKRVDLRIKEVSVECDKLVISLKGRG